MGSRGVMPIGPFARIENARMAASAVLVNSSYAAALIANGDIAAEPEQVNVGWPCVPLPDTAKDEQARVALDVNDSVATAVTPNDLQAAVPDAVNASEQVADAPNDESAADAELVKTVPVAPLPEAAKGAAAAVPELLNVSALVPVVAKDATAADPEPE